MLKESENYLSILSGTEKLSFEEVIKEGIAKTGLKCFRGVLEFYKEYVLFS